MSNKKLNSFANTDEIEQAAIGVVLYRFVGRAKYLSTRPAPSHILEHRTH